MKQKKNLKFQKAFTLIELLIVIAIIGLLASIVLIAVGSARTKTHITAAIENAQQVSKGLQLYYDTNGSYPYAGAGGITSGTDKYNSLASTLQPYVQLPPDDPNYKIHYTYYGPNNILGGSFAIIPQQCVKIFSGYVFDVGMPANSYTQGDGGIFIDGYEVYGGDYSFGTMAGGSCN